MDDAPVVEGFLNSLKEKIENIPGLTTLIKRFVLTSAVKDYLPPKYHHFAPAVVKELLASEAIQIKIDNVLSDIIYERFIQT